MDEKRQFALGISKEEGRVRELQINKQESIVIQTPLFVRVGSAKNVKHGFSSEVVRRPYNGNRRKTST